jgi:hypothetical protein
LKELKHAKDLNKHYEGKYNTTSTNNNKSEKQYKLLSKEYVNLKEEYDEILNILLLLYMYRYILILIKK